MAQAYLDQTETILAGERDYRKVMGRTGPLVYPAGHVWLFVFFDYLSDHGARRLLMQVVFLVIQVATVGLLARTVGEADARALKWCLLWATTQRARNVFVNGLFNDAPQVLLVYAALYLLLVRRQPGAALLTYSLAVSVKMSALLYAPAFLLVYWHQFGLRRTVAYGLAAGAVQVALALPFLATHPRAYLERSFELGRQFHHFLSHNWKFLPEPLFHDRRLHVGLLVAHVALVLFYYYRRGWLRRRDPARPWAAADQLDAFVVTNLVGVVCARSLHYSFYLWYFHTLPWIYYRLGLGPVVAGTFAVGMEVVWNQWQSYKSYDLLHSGPVREVTVGFAVLHIALVALVLWRARPTAGPPPPADKSE